MIRIAWRSLTAHKLRTFLTTLAILLGVAMICGTYVLSDQIDRGFKNIFTDAYKGIDVTITRKAKFASGMSAASEGLPQTLEQTVRDVDGVAKAYGYVTGMGAIAVRGKVVSTGGAPTLFFSAVPTDISNTSYVKGGLPEEPGEVSVIQKLAQDEDLDIGSTLTVVTPGGSEEVRVTGIFTFASQSSLGGSTLIDAELTDMQRWFGMQGRFSEIDAKAVAGVSSEELATRIEEVVPAYAEVKTGTQAAADQTKQMSDAIGAFLKPMLLSFGGIAVFVGAFIIFNAFSMTVAQRRREFAMLRALGASRRQVLVTLSAEALVMGLLASALGILAGLGLAAGVIQLFQAVGVDIPHSGLVLSPRTVAVSLAVGVIVTLLSALVPAWRATRVPPVAALQEGAALPPGRFARFMPVVAVVVAALGVAGIVAGMYGPGTTTTRLVTIAFGAVLVFLAVAIASKYFIRPLAAVLGWPLQKLAPVSGRLARDNTVRNPARTAATASALMIGLGVVVFVAVFAQGLKSSFVDAFDKVSRADFIIQSEGFVPLPSDTATKLQSLAGVQTATGMDMQQVRADGKQAVVMGIDPGLFQQVWRFDWLGGGSDELLGQLGTSNAVVEEQTASSLGVAAGDSLTVETMDGARAKLKVTGIYRDPMMLNGIVVGTSGYQALFPSGQLFMVLVKAAPGSDLTQEQERLQQALAEVPTAKVQTAQEYKDSLVGQVNQLLNLVYGLLAMSVIISLFGIVNTLVLAVYERTREIGLLRAIGSSRRQIRATVRYESVITSIIGALMGIVVGVLFAWVVTTRFAGQGITFSVPGGQLVIFLILGVVVGVIAAILPARRAARIDILEAIHYE